MMRNLLAKLDGYKRVLSILALVAVLGLKAAGKGDYEPVLREVLVLIDWNLDGVPVAQVGLIVASLYAAYDGARKAREAKKRAENHVTPPGDGPAGLGR